MFDALDEDYLRTPENIKQEFEIRDTIGFRENGIAYFKSIPDDLQDDINSVLERSKSTNEVECMINAPGDLQKHQPPYIYLAFEEGVSILFTSYKENLKVGMILSNDGSYVEDFNIVQEMWIQTQSTALYEIQEEESVLSEYYSRFSSVMIYKRLVEKNKNRFQRIVSQYKDAIEKRESKEIVESIELELYVDVLNYFSGLYAYYEVYKKSKGIAKLVNQKQSNNKLDPSLKFRNVICHNVAPDITFNVVSGNINIVVGTSNLGRNIFYSNNSKNKSHYNSRKKLDIEKLVNDSFEWVEESFEKFEAEVEEKYMEL